MPINSNYLEYAFNSYNKLLKGRRPFLSNQIILALLGTNPDRYNFWLQLLKHTDPAYLDPNVSRLMRLKGNNLHAVADHLDRYGFTPTPV